MTYYMHITNDEMFHIDIKKTVRMTSLAKVYDACFVNEFDIKCKKVIKNCE
jgi:hypothetical protein